MASNSRVMPKAQQDFIVFVVGMRINRLWAVHQWMPVMIAMPMMFIEQMKNREIGVIGTPRTFVSGRLIQVQQYWKTYEDLERYAKGDLHLPAWSRFNKAARKSKAVGIYHETYKVVAGTYEGIYVNVDEPILLGSAIGVEEVDKNNKTSRQRMYGA